MTRRYARCSICGRSFTAAEWDVRHTDYDDLEDCHETCCELAGPCSQRSEEATEPVREALRRGVSFDDQVIAHRQITNSQ